jgi:predicted CopG family antitoxin
MVDKKPEDLDKLKQENKSFPKKLIELLRPKKEAQLALKKQESRTQEDLVNKPKNRPDLKQGQSVLQNVVKFILKILFGNKKRPGLKPDTPKPTMKNDPQQENNFTNVNENKNSLMRKLIELFLRLRRGKPKQGHNSQANNVPNTGQQPEIMGPFPFKTPPPGGVAPQNKIKDDANKLYKKPRPPGMVVSNIADTPQLAANKDGKNAVNPNQQQMKKKYDPNKNPFNTSLKPPKE